MTSIKISPEQAQEEFHKVVAEVQKVYPDFKVISGTRASHPIGIYAALLALGTYQTTGYRVRVTSTYDCPIQYATRNYGFKNAAKEIIERIETSIERKKVQSEQDIEVDKLTQAFNVLFQKQGLEPLFPFYTPDYVMPDGTYNLIFVGTYGGGHATVRIRKGNKIIEGSYLLLKNGFDSYKVKQADSRIETVTPLSAILGMEL